ncbi:unnamed protein product [Moneuplotes crassus]|uniref:AP2/ERF domain-containing protein n=1 Tax=Euplotes crassus TaxID=5936 RepID=A0AAD2D652_EUPCR|nr:unnamed protein product [Moneuplotes crassus]
MCSYSDILQEFSSMYCLSDLDSSVLKTQDYCLCSTQEIQKTLYPKSGGMYHQARAYDMEIFQQAPQTNISIRPVVQQNIEQHGNVEPLLRKRRRNTKELNITERLTDLRLRILSGYVTKFTCSAKKAKSTHKKNLRRRSKYIGVSRNNSNWQALLNVDQIKKYIGTFTNELQAARAYDIYSVAMRGEEASLNFNYSGEEMLERIEYFLEHKTIKFDS